MVVGVGDQQQDEDDPILVEGYRLAKELVEACSIQGRRRRLEAYGSDEVKLFNEVPSPYPHRSSGQVGRCNISHNLLLVCVESHGSEPPGAHKLHLGLNHSDKLQRNLWV